MSDDQIAEIISVFESMQRKISWLEVGHTAIFFAIEALLTAGCHRAQVVAQLRSFADTYRDLALPRPLADEDIDESVQAILALASKLDTK